MEVVGQQVWEKHVGWGFFANGVKGIIAIFLYLCQQNLLLQLYVNVVRLRPWVITVRDIYIKNLES